MFKRILFTFTLSIISTGLMAGDVENAQLFNAVRHGDVAGVQAAIEQHANVNVCSVNGNTPLHMAVLIPDSLTRKEIITLLVRNGARVDLSNDTGQLPADLARMTPDFADIQELLGVGGCPVCLEDIEPKDDFVRGSELFGCDPRHIAHRICLFDSAGRRLTSTCPTCRATRDEHAAHAQRLALLGHYYNQQEIGGVIAQQETVDDDNISSDTDDEFPQLIEAVRDENVPQVQTLLARGADVNVRDRDGMTALMHAACADHMQIVSILLAHPNIDVNAHDEDGWTALMWASGNIAMVTALLAHPSIDVNARDEGGYTALMMIANTRGDHIEVVNALLAHPNIDVNMHDGHGGTALMLAADRGHTEIIAVLLAHPGIDINEGLVAAAQIGNVTWVQTLLAQGALVNAHNGYGYTALMTATQNGHTEIVTPLLAYPGIDVNAHDSRDFTSLMVAAERGNIEIVAALLAHPSLDVNTHDRHGDTALMWAVKKGNATIVTALLTHPHIDVNAHSDGLTALDHARGCGHVDIERMLIEHGARACLFIEHGAR